MNLRTLIAVCALAVACVCGQANAQDNQNPLDLPITNSPSLSAYQYKPLTYAQQRARFESEQRALRMEWNNWIGYSPLRPNVNASYTSASSYQNYYATERGVIMNTGHRGWYW
jgi:hypothetical protein